MGPLVPDIISGNLNYILALLIGILFGAILEQAGFSTSKKLVGLFYGYDFTVLRVFFTAGITAMVGVMAFVHFGLLDINLVYINPTFLWSAIVGGLIMGLGFVLGGFCPGTSVCAAAIGKIDAMIFIFGSFFGVLIFAEGYPAFESLYKAANLGNPRIFQTLNISENLFAFLTVFVALVAFYFVSLIEKKVNKEEVSFFKLNKQNVLMACFGCLLLILSLTMTDRKSFFLKLVEDENFVKNYPLEEMTPDELAFRLTCQKCEQLRIIDLRNAEEYNKWSLPNSTLFTVDNLFEKEPNLFLKLKRTKRVFVADDEMTERKAAIMALKMGYKEIKILKGGLDNFTKEILQFEPIKEPKTIDEQYRNRFRTKAKIEIAELIKNNKPQGPVEKKQKRALGGC
ncbi:MAG: YeeE/YedE thiosulfate transporter family protein [Acidobacteriota bacterium]